MKVFLPLSNQIMLFRCIWICAVNFMIMKTTVASVYLNSSCTQINCGTNSVCVTIGPSSCQCLCPYQMQHKPNQGCVVPECREDYDCRRDQECRDGKCISLCEGKCGDNSRCEVIPGGRVTCTCYNGFTGDALYGCRPLTESEICSMSCGTNQECRISNGVALCNCRPGFIRDSRGNCIHECEVDTQCSINQYCDNYRCKHVCRKCGVGAQCTSFNGIHDAICECPKGFKGNPYIKCEPECYTNEECPFNKPFCQRGRCYNPCPESCGTGAICLIQGSKIACACPSGTAGNPLYRCDKIKEKDPCKPNPCGRNALCETGSFDGRPCAICTCPKGLKGNPNLECVPGDCNDDNECFSHEYCRQYRCVNVCTSSTCGRNAKCSIQGQRPICSCSEGLSGDPSQLCYSIRVQPLY